MGGAFLGETVPKRGYTLGFRFERTRVAVYAQQGEQRVASACRAQQNEQNAATELKYSELTLDRARHPRYFIFTIMLLTVLPWVHPDAVFSRRNASC